MSDARGDRFFKTHVALGPVEQQVEQHVPAHRNQRNHQRQPSDARQWVIQQPRTKRRANGDGKGFEHKSLEKTFID